MSKEEKLKLNDIAQSLLTEADRECTQLTLERTCSYWMRLQAARILKVIEDSKNV